MEFSHTTLAQRVHFGTGRAAENLAEELAAREMTRPMMIVSNRARTVGETATAAVAPGVWWTDIAQHVPVTLVDRAVDAASEAQVDGLVCIGGGSIIGLAKAVALRTGLSIIAVPTTYSGSEATNLWGMTENGVKTTGVDQSVLPVTVIYDAELSRGLPTDLTVASALNALAHCVDSLWAPRADPINQVLALAATRVLVGAIRGMTSDDSGLANRENALYGAYLAGVGLAGAGAGLHHKICHVLGGTFDMPHAQTHAVVLPHVLEFNAPSLPVELATDLATALGATEVNGNAAASAVTAMRDLYRAAAAPSNLADLGFPEDGIELAVQRVLAAAPASNPSPVTAEGLTALLTAARTGTPVATAAP